MNIKKFQSVPKCIENKINKDNLAFDSEAYMKAETLREDCRSLHTEPLHQGAELPRQAVAQKGLSTFRKAFTLDSLADSDLKGLLRDLVEERIG